MGIPDLHSHSIHSYDSIDCAPAVLIQVAGHTDLEVIKSFLKKNGLSDVEIQNNVPCQEGCRYQVLYTGNDRIYAFTCTLEDRKNLVILNFSAETPRFTIPLELLDYQTELLTANYPVDSSANLHTFSLRPYEVRILRLFPYSMCHTVV